MPQDSKGTRWVFSENGIEAVVETPLGAKKVSHQHRSMEGLLSESLELWLGENVSWDWLHPTPIFLPFSLRMQALGVPREFGLRVTGQGDGCELQRGALRLKWTGTRQRKEMAQRTWWGWVGGKEILPSGFTP